MEVDITDCEVYIILSAYKKHIDKQVSYIISRDDTHYTLQMAMGH